LIAIAVGCGPADVHVGGKPRQKYYKAIVSLSPSAMEILSTLNMTGLKRVVGRTAYDNYPKQVESIPVVASVKPDYEKLAEVHPDLIIYDSALYNDADIQKIKQLGADTFPIDADTVDGYVKQVYGLASLVGGETMAADYIDRVNSEEAGAAATKTHPKVAIIMPGQGAESMIDGTDSFQADVVKVAGGTPVGPKGDKFVPVNAEELISENPDWIVQAGNSGSFISDPRFKSLKAIASKQIVAIDPDVLLRRGGRVDTLIRVIHNAISK
jgi:iron complex transport system substrate-binding protein